MRVLAVGAHPDDLEILCGGTLARYVREGHEVVMCNVALGNRGSFEHTSEEIAAIRAAEASQASALIGAERVSLGLADGEIYAGDSRHRLLMVDLIRQARPDLVLTHAPNDYMADHNEVSKLVFDASFLATIPLLQTQLPHHTLVTPIYYMDTLMGVNFVPHEFVDITEVVETKSAMIAAHDSQLTWLRVHDKVDIVEQACAVARFRGLQCGVRFAEGFTPCQAWLRGTTRRLLP